MDPYLWTWLARYWGACALVAVWSAAAVVLAARRERAAASLLGLLAASTGLLLATHLGPLLTGGGLPRDPWALDAAGEAPYLAFAVASLLAGPEPGPTAVPVRRSGLATLRAGDRFDLLTLAPALLWSRGAPAWLLAAAWIGGGHLMGGRVRGWLLVGIAALALAAFADVHRLDLRSVALHEGFGFDDSWRVASAVAGTLELAGWSAVTWWTVRRAAGPSSA